jgi:hypothetical protein
MWIHSRHFRPYWRPTQLLTLPRPGRWSKTCHPT